MVQICNAGYVFLAVLISTFLEKTDGLKLDANVYKKSVGMGMSRLNAMNNQFSPVVAGAAGGVAETVAYNLLQWGKEKDLNEVTLILDQAPFSPKLLQSIQQGSPKLNVYFGELGSGKVQRLNPSGNAESCSVDWQEILSKKIVVTVDEAGDTTIRREVVDKKNPKKNSAIELLQQLNKVLPSSVASIVGGASLEVEKDQSEGGIGKFLGGGMKGVLSFRKWSETNQTPFSAVRVGELVGAVPGLEPMPFLGLPLAEPELHPSHELLSVVCSSVQDVQTSSKEKCTRDNIASLLARLVLKQRESLLQKQPVPLSADNSLLISISGASPSDREWEALFQRLLVGGSASGRNSVILTMEFGKILRPQAIVNYLVDVWFSQAVLDTATATIATGARPVRIVRASGQDVYGASIVWEELDTANLKVVNAGSLDIMLNVNSSPPTLTISRNSKSILPGEAPLLDKLQEGINNNVYKKQLCEPLAVNK